MRYLCLFFTLLALPVFAAETVPLQADTAYYTKLRMDYAQRPDYDTAWNRDDEREAASKAYKAEEYQKAFDLAGKWLAKVPVDAEMHMLRAAAATGLGDLKSYMNHITFAYGLMQSVLQSGDGLKPETAFKVISVAEEYAIFREFGVKLKKQGLVDGNYDRMECVMPNGQEVILYFDVRISMDSLAKQLSPDKEAKRKDR